MEQIKPIETFYNGYRFRSRLEARWAVFFTKAGIMYEYEPEGFLVNGKPYLPDFFLPWFDSYVEIKPKGYDKIQETTEKLEALAYAANKPTILCVGDPLDDDMRIFCFELDEDSGGEWWPKCRFLEGASWYTDDLGEKCEIMTSKHWVSLAIGHTITDMPICNDRLFLHPSEPYHTIPSTCPAENVISYRDDFNYAKIAARQARFEHGEKP